MARDGVQSIKAEPDGLYGTANRGGLATCVMVPWEDVPYDVRQHLAEVFRFLNQRNDEAVAIAAVKVRDKKMSSHWKPSWISEATA